MWKEDSGDSTGPESFPTSYPSFSRYLYLWVGPELLSFLSSPLHQITKLHLPLKTQPKTGVSGLLHKINNVYHHAKRIGESPLLDLSAKQLRR